jgi:hypothetical protein
MESNGSSTISIIERLQMAARWYECVYLHAWETGSEAKAGIRNTL